MPKKTPNSNESIKKSNVVGRELELEYFKRLQQSKKSEFIAVYGRRRIGKTFLIREIYKTHSFFFEFSGTRGLNTQKQIKNFYNHFSDFFQKSPQLQSDDWGEAFAALKKEIEQIKENTSEKKIIFWDELPWLASRKSGFLEALDYFWNSYLSKRSDFILIICGSAAHWMIGHVINDKGGLHNRVTRPPLLMQPFTLSETQRYLKHRQIELDLNSILDLYMATGGVAFYLDQMNRGESAAQFINSNFFATSSGLKTEFDRLYQSLFESYDVHINIVKILAQHPHGLTYDEVAELLKRKSGGSLTRYLKELSDAGFIDFMPAYQKYKRLGIYRLIDEYSLFYLNWIEKLPRKNFDTYYWQKQIGKPLYYSWKGNSFETICVKHCSKIIEALGIAGLTVSTYSLKNEKVQIDLILDRSDKVVNLCEIKCSDAAFEMTQAELIKIKKRKEELAHQMKTKKQIFVTLITPQPAKKNKYYLEIVDQEINLERLF